MPNRTSRRRSGPERADAVERASKVLAVIVNWLQDFSVGGSHAFMDADLGPVWVVDRTQNGCQITVEKQDDDGNTVETSWFDIRVSFVTSEKA